MTNLEITLLTYAILAIIYETIHFFFAYKSFKKKVKEKPELSMVLSFLKTAPIQALKKRFLTWYTIPVIVIISAILLATLAQFMFPLSMVKHVKKLFGYKSEADKMLEQIDEAKKRSDEFMMTEGVYCDPKDMPEFSLNISDVNSFINSDIGGTEEIFIEPGTSVNIKSQNERGTVNKVFKNFNSITPDYILNKENWLGLNGYTGDLSLLLDKWIAVDCLNGGQSIHPITDIEIL